MRFLRVLPLALPAFFMFCLTRCFNTKPSEEPGPADAEEGGMTVFEKKEEIGEKKVVPSEVRLPGSNTADDKCEADGSAVMLDKVPEGGEDFEVELKIYGSMRSALLAFRLPKYQHRDLSDIYITDGQGNLIAQRGVSDVSDISDNNTLNIMTFDNLWLEDVKQIVFLFRSLEGKFQKKSIPGEISLSETFRGLKVVNLNQSSFQQADYYDRHVRNNFAPEEKQYTFEKDESSDIQASFDARFYQNEDWSETIVTDLMGQVLEEHGENFTDLSKNTMFIAYRLMHRKYYFRTFIRIA